PAPPPTRLPTGCHPAFGTSQQQAAPPRRRERSCPPSPPRAVQTIARADIEARHWTFALSRPVENQGEEPGNNARPLLSAIRDSWPKDGPVPFPGTIARQAEPPPRSRAHSYRERQEAFANEQSRQP